MDKKMYDFSNPNDVAEIRKLLEDDASDDPELVEENTGEQQKPEVITFYNTTKGGVDTADQMCTFSVSRNTRRWPMVIFFACLNVAGINSQVISIANKLEPLKRRIFLKTLSHQLTIGQLARRSLNTSGMPTHLQSRLKRFLPQEKPENTPTLPPKRRKCGMCMAETGFRRMTNYECKNCLP
ncbi:uncharacterized protein LOC112127978 [Cimex lectularius]|uniref:PiggyBac transposable element-derived protein domain-containing protein n=1 Tax=Cimex lectularius TaxID=79782 RepID=A0A8I6SR96_CIMLE|nr:uncharacterized protein LOC112127978 [Cimex lectularius]